MRQNISIEPCSVQNESSKLMFYQAFLNLEYVFYSEKEPLDTRGSFYIHRSGPLYPSNLTLQPTWLDRCFRQGGHHRD